MAAARKKLQSLSYGPKGQDPKKLFSHYDRDNSGHLDFNEFRNAVRRGGHLTPSMLSDGDLRKLFSAVDDDSSGDVSIDELTAFVWGEHALASAADAAPSTPTQGGFEPAPDGTPEQAAEQEVSAWAAAMHLALHATDPSAQTRLLFRYFKQVSDEKTKAEIDGMVRATGGEQLPALCAQLNEQYGVDPLALVSGSNAVVHWNAAGDVRTRVTVA